MNVLLIGAAVASVLFCAHRADSQELRRTATLSVDNDYLDFVRTPRERSDDNYTQGARLSTDLGHVPAFARPIGCAGAPACGVDVEVGQLMFTPTEDAAVPLPGQRAFAGWLYGKASVAGADVGSRRTLGLTTGVTGPWSVAEQAQRRFHEMFHFWQPLGWPNQLSNEVAFAIDARESWLLRSGGRLRSVVDLVPSVDAVEGTLRTAAGASAQRGSASPCRISVDPGARRVTSRRAFPHTHLGNWRRHEHSTSGAPTALFLDLPLRGRGWHWLAAPVLAEGGA